MTREEANRLLELAREAKLTGPEAAQWFTRLGPQREALQDAASYLAHHDAPLEAAELVAAVWRIWLVLGDPRGGRRQLAAALDAPNSKPSRSRALAFYGLAALAFRAGDLGESRTRNQIALEMARLLGEEDIEALALVGLGRVAGREGDYVQMRSLAMNAVELTRDETAPMQVAPLHLLAGAARMSGDYEEGAALYRQSLELNRRLGDRRMIAMELHNLGHMELHRGEVEAAESCFAEFERVRDPDEQYFTAMVPLNKAAVARARGDSKLVDRWLGQLQATLDEAGIVLDPDDAYEVDRLRSSTRTG